MNKQQIKRVVILGGGTAGWISAALLTKVLGRTIQITLVESEQIGIVGVGEATIPPILHLNNALGIKEADFLKATQGSIKLGIQFEGWNGNDSSYMHAFGSVGKNYPFCDFHHFWHKGKALGIAGDYWDYSINYQAASQNKFGRINPVPALEVNSLAYAYHFDAHLYAKYLSTLCQQHGVTRIEGKVAQVSQHPENGFISALQLEDGQKIEGDLFVDCSGLHGLLLDKTLNVGFEDWSHWLPCDRAWAVPTALTDTHIPYTRAIAREAGWQWRIPLQHRNGNGYVFSSRYTSEEQARQMLLDNLDAEPQAEPRLIKFKTGRRLRQWDKNVLAVGLSSGFLEPLESTSIHLIQSAVTRLCKMFPHNGIDPVMINEYNRQSEQEFAAIRDFVILHYKINGRQDSKFWQDLQRMDVPVSLQRKLDLFRRGGRVFRENDELFSEVAWQQVMIGQDWLAEDYHPMASALDKQQLQDLFSSVKTLVDQCVEGIGDYQQVIARLKL